MNTTHEPEHLSTRETADVCDVTYRQLDYLTRTGRVPLRGQGSGSRTRWPLVLVRALYVAARLREQVGDFPSCVEALVPHANRLGVESARASWLLLARERVVIDTSPQALVDHVRLHRGAVVLWLGDVLDDFDLAIAECALDREMRYGVPA